MSVMQLIKKYRDSFESIDYPSANLRLEKSILRKKRRAYIREAHIENTPEKDINRRNYLHLAALANKKNWLLYISKDASKEKLLESDIFGKTPLHYAAKTGYLCEIFHNIPAEVIFFQIQDTEGDTTLHILARTNKLDKNLLEKFTLSERNMLMNIKNNNNKSVLDIIIGL
jgi:ankyrin repeat protein